MVFPVLYVPHDCLAIQVLGFVTTSIGQSHCRHGNFLYIYPSAETAFWKERGGEIEGLEVENDGGEYEAQSNSPKNNLQLWMNTLSQSNFTTVDVCVDQIVEC